MKPLSLIELSNLLGLLKFDPALKIEAGHRTIKEMNGFISGMWFSVKTLDKLGLINREEVRTRIKGIK